MARRRSLNRRFSRKSMNISELNQDSEFIDTHDAMWWKNIEGDMTLRQSTRVSKGDTTASILDTESRIDLSEAPDEWWKNLDKSTVDTSQRISVRPSVKPIDPSSESYNSDESNEASIKKRKVSLRARPKKSIGTNDFLKALDDSISPERAVLGQKRKSRGENDDTRKKVRKRSIQRRIDDSPENPEDTTSNTSTDTDVIVKARPKPFKKSTKIPDGVFDDILNKESIATSSINVELSRLGNSSLAKSPTKERSVRSIASKSLSEPDVVESNPINSSDQNDVGLMRPPKTASHRNSRSSFAHKSNLTSEESEGDDTDRKKKKPLAFFGKKIREATTINPFDEIINEHMNDANDTRVSVNENSSFVGKTRSANRHSRSKSKERQVEERSVGKSTLNIESRESQRPKNSITNKSADESQNEKNPKALTSIKENRRTTSDARSTLASKSLLGENSRSQHIEETSDNDDENSSVASTTISLIGKTLEISLTRISTDQILQIQHSKDSAHGGNTKDNEASDSTSRTSRSTRHSRLITDSAYELPDKDRSPTPVISTSENESEKLRDKDPTLGRTSRTSLRSNRGINKNTRDSLISNVARTNVSRKNSVRNDSRTRLFSDEDISVEDIEDINRRNEKLARNFSLNENVGVSRASVSIGNESRRNIRRGEDESKEPEDNSLNLTNSPLNEKSLTSRSTIHRVVSPNKSQRRNQLDESIGENEAHVRMSTKFDNSHLKGESRTSIKNVSSNKSQKSKQLDESTNEDELEDAEGDDPESSKSRSKEYSRTSRKSVVRNKSQRDVESDKSTNEDEEEDAEELFPWSENSGFKEKSRTSRRNIAKKNSQRIIESDNEGEDAEELFPQSKNSSSQEKSRTSRKSIAKNESRRIIESDNEEEDAEEMFPQSKNSSLQEESRTSRKSIAKNESQRVIEPDKSVSEDKEKDLRSARTKSQNSQLTRKSRKSTKSTGANKSQREILSDESISEDESEGVKIIRGKIRNSELKNKSRTSTKSISEDEPKDSGLIPPKTRNSRLKDESRKSTKSAVTNKSQRNIAADESISEDEPDDTEIRQKSRNSSLIGKSRTTRKSVTDPSEAGKNIESDESISEDDVENAQESNSNWAEVKTGANIIDDSSHQNIRASIKINQDKAKQAEQSKATSVQRNFSTDHKINESRNISPLRNFSHERLEIVQSINEDHEENGENIVESVSRKTTNVPQLSKIISSTRVSTLSNLSPPVNVSTSKKTSPLDRPNDSRKQKNITDFFPSKFLQRSNNDNNNSSATEMTTSLDKEKLRVLNEKLKELKKRELRKMETEEKAKSKVVNTLKRSVDTVRVKKLQSNENGNAKNPRVVDKAYIVNGAVYKRPKLPRPKPWATDRLYRHLWKRMEPKYKSATRVRSEKFVVQLAGVVALTLRRKKYESYETEVDALMRDMARLDIIKTRNDFYDFCYDFLPYDFRVKVTPILLPGNKLTIPYDPKKLHSPILPQT